MVARPDAFKPQEIANTTWAFATAGQSDAALFRALARRAERCVGHFNAQDLANTAWVFAKAGQFDAQLVRALAGAAVHCIGDFNALDLLCLFLYLSFLV